MVKRWRAGLGVVMVAVTGAGTVWAEPAPAPANDAAGDREAASQEHFGFGAQLGFYNPNGIVVRGGARALSLEVAGGFVPILLSYGGSSSPDLKLLFPLEVTPQLVVHVVTFRNDIRGALRGGYRYNAALGHGGTLGAQIGKRLGRSLLLEGMFGVSYYPNASDELRGGQVDRDTDFNFPPELNYGLTAGLLFFP